MNTEEGNLRRQIPLMELQHNADHTTSLNIKWEEHTQKHNVKNDSIINNQRH